MSPGKCHQVSDTRLLSFQFGIGSLPIIIVPYSMRQQSAITKLKSRVFEFILPADSRAALICSKFVDNGYKIEDMMEAKEKAMIIDRDEILKPKHKLKDDKSKNNVLTFVANYDSFFKKELKTFFKKNDADLKQLIVG